MDNRAIGFFDSGIGGLTCVPYLFEELPKERIVYFGDTARTPYGSKAEKTIKQFSKEITKFLIEEDVKMIVIACNTISAICLEELQNEFPNIPFIGIIKPTAKVISELCSKRNDIGIIGTKVTINNSAYKKEIHSIDRELRVYEKACPVFVPLIEEGMLNNDIISKTIEYYLDDFVLEHRIDTLVLGCTHYPLLEQQIQKRFPNIKIINPSKEVVAEIKRVLTEEELYSDNLDGENIFYASDLSDNYLKMINKICSGNLNVKHKQL